MTLHGHGSLPDQQILPDHLCHKNEGISVVVLEEREREINEFIKLPTASPILIFISPDLHWLPHHFYHHPFSYLRSFPTLW